MEAVKKGGAYGGGATEPPGPEPPEFHSGRSPDLGCRIRRRDGSVTGYHRNVGWWISAPCAGASLSLARPYTVRSALLALFFLVQRSATTFGGVRCSRRPLPEEKTVDDPSTFGTARLQPLPGRGRSFDMGGRVVSVGILDAGLRVPQLPLETRDQRHPTEVRLHCARLVVGVGAPRPWAPGPFLA